jgi:hypothetical protein
MIASFPADIISFANSVCFDNKWYILYFYLLIILIFIVFRRWVGEKYDGVRVCWHPTLQKPYPHFVIYFIF